MINTYCDMAPYELVFNTKPDITNMILSVWSEEIRMLGYSENINIVKHKSGGVKDHRDVHLDITNR
jgi:hypothetical protein